MLVNSFSVFCVFVGRIKAVGAYNLVKGLRRNACLQEVRRISCVQAPCQFEVVSAWLGHCVCVCICGMLFLTGLGHRRRDANNRTIVTLNPLDTVTLQLYVTLLKLFLMQNLKSRCPVVVDSESEPC